MTDRRWLQLIAMAYGAGVMLAATGHVVLATACFGIGIAQSVRMMIEWERRP